VHVEGAGRGACGGCCTARHMCSYLSHNYITATHRHVCASLYVRQVFLQYSLYVWLCLYAWKSAQHAHDLICIGLNFFLYRAYNDWGLHAELRVSVHSLTEFFLVLSVLVGPMALIAMAYHEIN